MSKLLYRQGDATQPVRLQEGTTVFGPHCCNDIGGWGSGYVNALTARFGESPRGMYKMWHKGANTEQVNARMAERANPTDAKLLHQTRFVLGGIQLLGLPNDYVLVNMIGQHNHNPDGDPFMASRMVNGTEILPPTTGLVEQKMNIQRKPIRYAAIAKAMFNLYDYIFCGNPDPNKKPEIHCPKFGSDLAGGDWKVIEALILELWVDNNIPVVVYEWVK